MSLLLSELIAWLEHDRDDALNGEMHSVAQSLSVLVDRLGDELALGDCDFYVVDDNRFAAGEKP